MFGMSNPRTMVLPNCVCGCAHGQSVCVCVCVLVRPGLNCHCSDFRTPIGSSSDVISCRKNDRQSQSKNGFMAQVPLLLTLQDLFLI